MSVQFTDACQVGGSIAGLMVAHALRGRGFNVLILEASTDSELRSPAGLSLGRTAQKLLKKYVPGNMPPLVNNSGRIKVDLRGKTTESTHLPSFAENICTSSWDEVRKSLCDGINANARWYSGSVELVYGARVTNVSQEMDQMAVEYTERNTGEAREELADIIIAADGPYSTVRQCVETNVKRPQYNNYVAWRGVWKHDLSQLRDENITTLHLPEGSYIVLYAVKYSDCVSY